MMALSLLNIALPNPGASPAPPGVAPAAGAFDLLLPIADPADPRHEPAPDGKQIGKDVPLDAVDIANPLAWLAPPVAPPVSKPLPAQHGGDAPIAPAVSRPLPLPAGETPPVQPAPDGTPSTPQPTGAASGTSGPTPIVPPPSPASPHAARPPEPHDRPRSVSRLEPGVAREAPPASTTPPLPASRIAPAAQVFADAIHRAVRDDRGPATPDAVGLAAASDIKSHAVAATAEAQHGALDLRQEQWPARMIERIDALRDAANAGDASIRLIPDALGKIDISLKRDGDAVAVHFTAQQPETRQLLADAAPRLAELAEARGLKLAQGGTDTAAQQQQQRQQPPAPAVAPQGGARAADTESTDIRIA